MKKTPPNTQTDLKKKYLVTHHIVAQATDLNTYLAQNLKLEESKISYLLSLGAVYLNEKRTQINSPLLTNDYLRVHHVPKRFPIENIVWKNQIVFENSDMIVINKPYGIPVHATLDNCQENVIMGLSKSLDKNCYITHRIDIGTSGLLILAKTIPAQRNINEQFNFKKVRKFYSAFVSKKVELGIYTHYMKKDPRAPKVLSPEAQLNWKKCDLEILGCDGVKEDIFQVELELFTGRSHQIRSQLSFLGSPILGDVMYGGKPYEAPIYPGEFYFLSCTRIKVFDFEFSIPLLLKPEVSEMALVSTPKTLF